MSNTPLLSEDDLQTIEDKATYGYRMSNPGSCDANREAAVKDVRRLLHAYRILLRRSYEESNHALHT